ncbi:hypothetical protein OS493_029319 [Desmophyllum pertusum]|uniref:Uncharacterized protein n=1 Tax=Desmophyllum pertusum TaxID=174260 RepID=A0A9W9ZAG2_9CNID|nr:hypothetical protein OS493_029319 [Desmophyllum pertusum]
MTLNIVVMFLAVFCLWNIADADTEESLEMRIYDRDLKRTDTQMRKMLDEADLEKHGFKLEITTKLKQSGSGSDSEQAYQKNVLLLQDSRLLTSTGG